MIIIPWALEIFNAYILKHQMLGGQITEIYYLPVVIDNVPYWRPSLLLVGER